MFKEFLHQQFVQQMQDEQPANKDDNFIQAGREAYNR
jgi:hypothetical protein